MTNVFEKQITQLHNSLFKIEYSIFLILNNELGILKVNNFFHNSIISEMLY